MSLGQVVFYGDSILVGAFAGNASTSDISVAWPTRVANAAPTGSWDNFGRSGASIYSDTNGNTTTAAFVAANLTPLAPDTLWDEMGINDFEIYYPQISMATFLAAKGAIWDALQGSLPGVKIYAQGLLPANGTGTRGDGTTLAQWNTGIAALVAARASWTTFVDWGSLLTYPGDYASAPHPSAVGHAKLFQAAMSVFGLPVPVLRFFGVTA